ncbi:MAG: TIM barrel protein [Planctomycetaceae bacterium]|nr:TIM barrel protein [Planctomycetaceae bacterium]
MRIKQSVCIPMFGSVPMETLIREAAKIGYGAVETWGVDGLEQTADMAASHGMCVSSFIGSGTCGGGFNDPSLHTQLEDQTRRSIDLAAKLKIPGFIVFSGNRRAGMTDDEGADITAQSLLRLAPYAEAAGVNINLELLNSKRDHKDYQCDRTNWGLQVVKRVNSPRVKLLYDIYHMQIMEGDVIATIRDSIDWIAHFHTAGNPGRRDFDDLQEMNYAGICKAIAQTGYTGYVGHEFSPKADPIEALRKAFTICDQQ